jgi:hypothetical protein
MRISRKRGSWILQFADEKQNLRYRSAPRSVRLMSSYGTEADMS